MRAIENLENMMGVPLANAGWVLIERKQDELVFSMKGDSDKYMRLNKRVFAIYADHMMQNMELLNPVSSLLKYLGESPVVLTNNNY